MNKRFKILVLSAIFPLLMQSCSASAVDDHSSKHGTEIKNEIQEPAQGMVILNAEEIKNLSTRVGNFKSVISSADKKLSHQPNPSEDFSPAPHYTASGVNNSQNNDKILARDFRAAYDLALAYLVTKDKRYATTAQRIIDAWSKTLKTIGTEQGKASINFNAPYLIAAAAWTKDVNNWDTTQFNLFLRNIVFPANTMQKNNNHGLWGCFTSASIASYLKDMEMLRKVKNRWETILINGVQPDGTMPAEMERSATSNWRGGPDKGKKGISYTHYALLPASMTAKIFSDNGIPIWNSKGGILLEKAYKKAAEWTMNPASFPYYESNNGDLDGVENAAYFTLLNHYYPDVNAKKAIMIGKTKMNGFHLVEMFK